jgi:hypothetical protein
VPFNGLKGGEPRLLFKGGKCRSNRTMIPYRPCARSIPNVPSATLSSSTGCGAGSTSAESCAAVGNAYSVTTTTCTSSSQRLSATAIGDTALGADCVAHARMFFNRSDFDLASAASGSFALALHDAMIEQLRVDYRAMQGMIFGDPPNFEAVLESISSLETRLNGNGASESGVGR